MFHGRNLRKYRISKTNYAYSVTCCTTNRQPFFENIYLARKLIRSLKFQDDRNCTQTFAFVVMPDHFHWLFELKNLSISKVMHSVKSYSSQNSGYALWQNGFHERLIKREEDLVSISRYIVANPLRAGIVRRIEEYPHWDAVWLNGNL